MAHCPQQGNGKNGTIKQGDTVRMPNGTTGTAESFYGGSHTTVTVRDSAGYSHGAKTSEVEKVGK